MVGRAIVSMTRFYEGSLHDIEHFLKVYAYAKAIGESEKLPPAVQQTLELAAVVHDIACPLCRLRYQSTAGPLQEKEGGPLAEQLLRPLGCPEEQTARVRWLVEHHHTINRVEGADHQILLEADFLVNASESSLPTENIRQAYDRLFRTATGKALLTSIYQLQL